MKKRVRSVAFSLVVCLLICGMVATIFKLTANKRLIVIKHKAPEINQAMVFDDETAVKVGDRELLFSAETGKLTVNDSKKQLCWLSSPTEINEDSDIKGSIRMNYESQIYIEYADKSGNIYTLSSKAFCVNKGGLTVEKAKNGVRAYYSFPKCSVTIPVNFVLKNDRLSVSINVSEVYEGDDNYRLLAISLLPYFNAGGLDDNGFLFVPDGSGAIINFNNGKTAYRTYKKYVYGRDSSIGLTAATGHEENILLPVFGTSAPEGSSLGIITSGESRCVVNAQISQTGDNYNSVYPTFIYRDNTMASFNDKSWNKKEVRVFEVNPPKLEKFSVDYFFMDDNASYADMAKCYRNYLIEQGVLLDNQQQKEYPLYLNFYGSINAQKHVLGFPVNAEIPLTSYNDALKIIKGLKKNGVNSIVLKYNNWLKGGPESALPSGAKISGQLGGASSFNKLNAYMKENNIQGYYDFNLTDMYKSRRGYMKTIDSARMLNSSPAIQYQYSLSTLQKNEQMSFWYLLKPDKIASLSKQISKTVGELPGVSCDTLSQKLYSSFNDYGLDRVSAQQSWEESLSLLKKKSGKMLCKSPNAYAVKYANVIQSLPTQSSGYALFDADVPFYQIVLHGSLSYSIEPNNKFSNYNYGILKAIETGSSLQYEWIARNQDKISDTAYAGLYADDYDKWTDSAVQSYKKARSVLEKVAGVGISEHSIVSSDVRKTTFENGISVFVNYGNQDAIVGNIVVPANDYYVKED